MSHASPLIAILVLGLGLAFVFGTIANWLKISPLVGYLLAGSVIGPFTPGFVADQALAFQLAEVGVILLMFGVGLHFAPHELMAVRRIVVPGAVVQVAASAFLGLVVAWLAGWTAGAGVVFGLALSVASTVVLMRSLQERRLMGTQRGHVAVGWLVFQDLLMAIVLVLLPPLADVLKSGASSAIDAGGLAASLGLTLGKVAAFVALMLIVGRRLIPALLHYIAHTGSRELFRLAVLSVALGVAYAAAELFGVSFALGAFFAGMILSKSELSQAAAEESLPLRDAFAVLFFVSVGMLFNPLVLIGKPLLLLGALLVVLVGNAGAAFLMIRALGQPAGMALLVAAGLAQIGEFSFILGDLGWALGLLPQDGRDVILGTSLLTILINPAVFAALDRARPWLERRGAGPARPQVPPPTPAADVPTTRLTDHAVLVGYGRVGQLVGADLRGDGWPLLVIETADNALERLRVETVEVIQGNAAEAAILKAANLPAARLLLVAIPNAFEAGQIVQQARKANPHLDIISRAHFDAEVEHLAQCGANTVIMGEREIARSMTAHARSRRGGAAPATL